MVSEFKQTIDSETQSQKRSAGTVSPLQQRNRGSHGSLSIRHLPVYPHLVTEASIQPCEVGVTMFRKCEC